MSSDRWYRVDAQHYAVCDFDGEATASYTTLRCISYSVLRETPKGVWLKLALGGSRYVRRDYTHRGRAFAASTEVQAIADFKLRKAFRLRMLAIQVRNAERELSLADCEQNG